jgi:hypothetical protein
MQTVNPKDPTKMDCTCDIPGVGLNVANSSGYSALWSFYRDVPKLQYCE